MYYDPADYFDITQHEVDRQDELEYEVRAPYQSEAVSRALTPDVLHLFCPPRRWSCTRAGSKTNWV